MKYSIWMKLALIIISLSMIFSLVACNPSGNGDTEGSQESESGETESSENSESTDTKHLPETNTDEIESTENTTISDTEEPQSEETTESESTEPETTETTATETTEAKEDNVFELIDFTVSVPADREPVILQLTDTQIIDATQNDRLGESAKKFWGPEHMGAECFNYISEIVESTKPDLILLTGDLVYGEFDNSGASFTALVEFMDSLNVPWAPIFGNHEAESTKGVDWQCAQLEAAENCLFVQRTITGNGNYTVGVEQGGKLTRVFFMLDSNGYGNAASAESLINTHCKTTSGFGNDQIKWYTKLIGEIKELSPDTKLSFAFHIQLKAIVDSFATYTESADAVHIDRLTAKNDGDFGYIGTSRNQGWDKDYTVWNGLKALGVDSIFVGHEHTHSASIVYEGIRVQFGMKSSTYDQVNYIDADGNIKGEYHATGKTPWVGGSVMKLTSDGSIGDAYIYYCKNAGGSIDWDEFDKCDHSGSTSDWTVDENDPQYEKIVCSVCGEGETRSRTTNHEGLLLFGHEFIQKVAGNSSSEIMKDGPGGMSYVRLHSTKESGNEFLLLHGDKNKALTNLGGYVAILYRTSVEQKLMYACDSTSSVQNGGVQKLSTYKCAEQWNYIVHENVTTDFYDGEKMTAFAFYQFAAGIDRTLDDYTDIAFIGFFSTADEAWSFFNTYREAYSFEDEDFTSPYYVHLNGGNLMIDGNRVVPQGTPTASSNKPLSFDCSSLPLATVASSLQLYGWCAAPGGIQEYGYYVIDNGTVSEYKFLTGGKDTSQEAILNQVTKYNYPSSISQGILMGATNPINISLAGYEGKTVTVVYVAKTNWGDEIELARFNTVTVPTT